MPQHPHEGRVLPVDPASGDDANPMAAFEPITQDEIDDYLYDESRPAAERVDRLRALREQFEGLPASDVGGDMKVLIGQIDAAIDTLSRADDEAPLDAATAYDPADHLDALSPDDEDAIERITGEDEEEGR
jgi:hypothetical protein